MHAIQASSSSNDQHLITILSPDTDVFISLCNFYDQLSPSPSMKVNNDIYSSVKRIGHNKAKALIGFYAFTGCDTTGSFRKRGKIKWLKNFNCCADEFTDAFVEMGESEYPSDNILCTLERFVCEQYCPKYKGANLSEARWYLFQKNSKGMDLLPLSRDAFNQHVQRANFQSRIWKESGAPMQNVGDPVNHGWNRDEEGLYHAIGFENTIAPKDIIELVRCGF